VTQTRSLSIRRARRETGRRDPLIWVKRGIIRRFGRYPHRNAILGRPSTPEEIAFLREPGRLLMDRRSTIEVVLLILALAVIAAIARLTRVPTPLAFIAVASCCRSCRTRGCAPRSRHFLPAVHPPLLYSDGWLIPKARLPRRHAAGASLAFSSCSRPSSPSAT
jgi:hypothetical protein